MAIERTSAEVALAKEKALAETAQLEQALEQNAAAFAAAGVDADEPTTSAVGSDVVEVLPPRDELAAKLTELGMARGQTLTAEEMTTLVDAAADQWLRYSAESLGSTLTERERNEMTGLSRGRVIDAAADQWRRRSEES